MTELNPITQPFYMQGATNQALLFLHGFTASPSELYPAAELLHAANSCTISGILLPGHGTNPAELNKTGWQDWRSAAEKEIWRLLKEYEDVFIAGLSMGALLALYVGSRFKEIKGIVSINAPIFTQYPIITSLAPLIQKVIPYVSKVPNRKENPLELKGRFAYDCYPVKAYTSLMKLRKMVINELAQIRQPTLLLQSLRDKAVKRGSAQYLKDHMTSCRVELVSLPKSGHIATMEDEVELIVNELVAFMGSF